MKRARSPLDRPALLAVLALLAFTSVAAAQGARGMPGGPGMRPGAIGGPGHGADGFGSFSDPGGPPPTGPGGPPPPALRLPPPEVLESLGLSDAQRAKLADRRDADLRQAIRDEADVRIAELDLRRAVESDKPDPRAIDDAIDKLGAIRTAMLKARIASVVAFREMLTPAQRAKLRDARPGPPR